MSLPTTDYITRLQAVAEDYMYEHRGWSFFGQGGKQLPYGRDQGMLESLHRIGCFLYSTCPVIRSATEKFISYVVSSGHTYDVLPAEPLPPGGLQVSKDQLQEIQWVIDWTQERCYPGGWQSMQEETVRRYLREGEVFRRKFRRNRELQVRFPEPYQIRQKPGANEPGTLGIVSSPQDATEVIGYWVNNNPPSTMPDDFDFVKSSRMQHIKYGTDGNDPRGVGPFPMIMCHSVRIKNTDVAMVELALTQSSYAVVRQYDQVITIEEIRRISQGFQAAQEDDEGNRQFGKEVDAKGFKFEFPSMGVDPKNFVEIIAQEVRFIAGVLDMPEYILLTSMTDGSRASIVSAEGPFSRRIQREQSKLATHDVDLLWDAVSYWYGWTDKQLSDYRRAIKIVPNYPLPYTRDILKDTQAMSIQVDKGLTSKRRARERLGNDSEQVAQELRREAQEEPAVLPDGNASTDQTAASIQAARNPAGTRG